MSSNYSAGNTFAVRIAEVLDDLGLSDAKAARLADIHRSQICRYKKGEEHPSPNTLEKIRLSLHVPPFVFYMDRSQAAPFVEEAKKSLKIVT